MRRGAAPLLPFSHAAATVARGADHSLAVKSDGTAWAWGANGNGELGDNTTTQRTSPVQVTTLSGAVALAGGSTHSSALGAPPSRATTYGYDRLYRLTSVTALTGPTSYTYDPVGNRLDRTRNAVPTSYAYDRADRITSAGGVGHTVNANGNLTARGSDSFAYDQADRLKSATVGGATSQYAYDGDGKRASSTVGSTTTRYVYDITAGLPVLLEDGARKYIWGLGLAYATDMAGTVQAVYHTDGLGSVRALTNAGGQVTDTYQTDEFGVPTVTTGSSGQPFGYTGEQRDSATGLLYLRERMYDPTTGRFLQRDPYAGGTGNPLSLHRYVYVLNNSVNTIDPSGLSSSKITDDPYLCQRPPETPWEWLLLGQCVEREQERPRRRAQQATGTCLPLVGVIGPVAPCWHPGITFSQHDPDVVRQRQEKVFGDHAAQWLGRAVKLSVDFLPWLAVVERATRSTLRFESHVWTDPTIAHLARIDGKWFVVHYYKEGERAGLLASAFIPKQSQIIGYGRALGWWP